ncbi:protoporphyrinogen oxidase [Plasmodium brasilianum]|uniref:Protoporphyrinogen oxidase n=2 Tax=Plasmodium (Plasmodium) TaxID=418103 RepID=A0A1D3RIQ7_PLAMA|nr:protoporphyrinogen oxidase, putative [Plasmodium malariae]KAI4837920.1 protoporphyrinogen oxidase [Plasmodium brasilianum]SCN45084.1 protoporphyrinogen oxidase, putative [Plasmodium malariae]
MHETNESETNGLSKDEVYDVVIVGGGLFSCCLYYFLKVKNGKLKILIIEKEEKLGGYIKTHKYSKDNTEFLYELGPNLFKLSEESYNLLKQLKLLSDIRILDKKLIRYIYYNNNLYPLHFNIIGYFIFPLIKFSNKIKFIFKLLFRKYKNVNLYDYDISVENYMKENFDLQHYNFLLLPLIYGSCAGKGNISAMSFFLRNLKLLKNSSSTLRIWRNRGTSESCSSPRGDNSSSCCTTTQGKKEGDMFSPIYSLLNMINSKTTLIHYVKNNILKGYKYSNYNKYLLINKTNNYKDVPSSYIERYFKTIKKIYVFVKYLSCKYFPLFGNQTGKKEGWKEGKESKGENEVERVKDAEGANEAKKRVVGKLISLKSGLYELINALSSYINKKYVFTNQEVDLINRMNEKLWMCSVRKQSETQVIYAKNVILTVNSKICSHILRTILPCNIRKNLFNISYSNIICVTLYFNKKDLNIPKNFFGFLSSDKKTHVLGCFYINNMFKERCSDDNIALLTLYIGGQNNAKDIYLEKEELTQIILKDLRQIFKIYNNAHPTILKVKKWYDAIPFYSNNYEKDLKSFLDELYKPQYKNLFVDSGWVTGTSISDRIASAKDLSDFMILKNLSKP